VLWHLHVAPVGFYFLILFILSDVKENRIHTPTLWMAFRNDCTTLVPWTPLSLKFLDHDSKTPCVNRQNGSMKRSADMNVYFSGLLIKKIHSISQWLENHDPIKMWNFMSEFSCTSSIFDCAHGKEKVKPRGFLLWLMWCFSRKDFKDPATCSKSCKKREAFKTFNKKVNYITLE